MFLVGRLPPLKGGGSNLTGDLTGFITTEHKKVFKKIYLLYMHLMVVTANPRNTILRALTGPQLNCYLPLWGSVLNKRWVTTGIINTGNLCFRITTLPMLITIALKECRDTFK